MKLEDIYFSHAPKVLRFFQNRMSGRMSAEDATQETFARLASVTPRTTIDNPQAYLFTIARSVAHQVTLQSVRERQLRGSVPHSAAEDRPDDQPDAETRIANREDLERVLAAIADLPPRCRTVFLLSRSQELSNGEIAEQLGVTRNAVEKQIVRALIACRAALNDK